MKHYYMAFTAAILLLFLNTRQANAGGIVVQIMQQGNATCNGSCNGYATAVASGGMAPYTYSWFPSGGNQPTATGLCAGTYTVIAVDSMGQTGTVTVTITEPTPVYVVATAGSSTTCACFTMGTANATGGNGGPYTYTWNPGNMTGATVSTLCPASVYTVTATDPNGCTGMFILTTSPAMQPGPSVTTNSTPASSQSTCDGMATAVVTGGTAPYTYMWSPGGQTTSTVGNLCPGTYTVCVTDANGCTSCQAVSVSFSTGTNDPGPVNGAINLFPNPASGMVEIQLPVTVNQMQLEIFDAFGRIVFAEQLNRSTKIDVGNWTNGVYIVRLASAEGTAARKLLISH